MTYTEKHEQARRLFVKQKGICLICKKRIDLQGSQRAHKVPQYKRHFKKWGVLIDDDRNIDLVCGLDCNKKVQLHQWEWFEFMEGLK